MSTHPFLPLYVDDFEAATAHLTPEEDGIYNRLMRLCWRTPGCSLADDKADIARKIRLPMADFERVAMPILNEFFVVVRGRFVQRRLKREYDDISRKKAARKAAGKKGGTAKALNSNTKPASIATVLPPDTCASPEPEPKPEVRTTTTDAQAFDWRARLAEAMEAAGDAADPTSTALMHAADLRAFVMPTSGEPCLWSEVLDAVRMTAARQRAKAKPIRSWRWIENDAWALRDKRLSAAAPDVAQVVSIRSSGPRTTFADQIAEENAEARRRAFARMDAEHG
jgi:uncharacterized protein YdaU (DUF1376 family)